jgi:hypothetical protein
MQNYGFYGHSLCWHTAVVSFFASFSFAGWLANRTQELRNSSCAADACFAACSGQVLLPQLAAV